MLPFFAIANAWYGLCFDSTCRWRKKFKEPLTMSVIADTPVYGSEQTNGPTIKVEPTHVVLLGSVRLTRNDLPLRFYVRMLAEKAHLQRSLMKMASQRLAPPE